MLKKRWDIKNGLYSERGQNSFNEEGTMMFTRGSVDESHRIKLGVEYIDENNDNEDNKRLDSF